MVPIVSCRAFLWPKLPWMGIGRSPPSVGQPARGRSKARWPTNTHASIPGGRQPRLEGRREPHGADDEYEANGIVPRQPLLEHDPGEDHEHSQGDDLLDDLELIAGELAAEIPAAIRRHHQAVFEERDPPRDEDDREERLALEKLEFQLPVPRNGHEDVGADEEEDGFHR